MSATAAGVPIDITYEGELHCRLRHIPSASIIQTDAPVDNQGKGAAFSPTDLVGAALGSCMLTTMGIVAQRHEWDIAGTRAHVVKEMVSEPARRIGRLSVTITFGKTLDEKQQRLLEASALACPVHKSLHPDVDKRVQFVYPEPA